jgi:hypothetical protein
MAAPHTRSSNPAIREVSRSLADARDAQILKVVAMVDAMPDRGAADQLIAPLRSRLAQLRPPRPLRFARLLFLPLDPLIVTAGRWRVEHPTIPRSAIPSFAAAVAVDLRAVGRQVAAMIEGHTTQDFEVVASAGTLLWRKAAEALADANEPADWETTGLSTSVHKPLARRIGALLFQADRLHRWTADAAQGLAPPEAHAVQALLEGAIRRDPDAQPMIIALLLARIPEVAPVLLRVATLIGQRGGALMRHAGEQAADLLLNQLEAPGGAEAHLGGQDLAEAGETVRRLTMLLGALQGESLSPDRRDRLVEVKERIKVGCQALFTERLSTDLLDPLRACTAGSGPEAGWELEAAARGLRALETEARRAGGDKTYDVLLGQAADAVREIIENGGLDRVGGLRLMEIVAGPEVALALLGEEDPGGFGRGP